jgi:hypothetical protein
MAAFELRPTRLPLAADPTLVTHRAYGLPKPAPTPEMMQEMGSLRINPTGELPEPLPIPEAAAAIGRLDGYAGTETDAADMQQQWPQLRGQFLIDRDGIVRWANVECATEGLAEVLAQMRVHLDEAGNHRLVRRVDRGGGVPRSMRLDAGDAIAVDHDVHANGGKVLLEQKEATDINIGPLANGMYMIMVYDENKLLLKTTKFAKVE